MILIDNLRFDNLKFNERRETLTSIDATGKYLLKVQYVKNPRKSRDVRQEFEVMHHLNSMGSKTCPVAYETGSINSSFLQERGVQPHSQEKSYDYILQEYVVSEENYSLADLLLSLIEQKKLGVYQGDVKPSNVRFNSKTGVCVLIDYDQAEMLTDEVRTSDNKQFLAYCDDHDKKKYGFGNWLRHFPGVSNQNSFQFLRGTSLDLANTTIFRKQKTTNSASGIYHTIDTPEIFALGSRSLDARAKILDSVDFSRSERVLDVGCNAGLLCEYLHDRGCKVTGVDNDPLIVIGAKIVSNILGRDINYSCTDLDFVEDIGEFDTVMLFSVFHHTRNPEENAKKIVKSCKRIIIETRLTENGKQPVGNQWVDTTRWSFQTLDRLVDYLEKTFHGFKLHNNLGFVDKGRYILELRKK